MKLFRTGWVMGLAGLTFACSNAGPEIYRIALDESALQTLPGNCYARGSAPSNLATSVSLRTEEQWVIWDGPDKSYLDRTGPDLKLGDTTTVSTNSSGATIEGTKNLFKAEWDQNYSPGQKRTQLLAVAFDSTGATPKGHLDVSANDTNASNPVCSASFPFSGRRIDATRISNYNPSVL